MLKTLRLLATAGLAITFGSCLALAQHGHSSDGYTVPPVPTKLEVPEGNTLFLKGSAQGTQNYICLPSTSGFAWTFFAPQATLFLSIKFYGTEFKQQLITHFLSPNPDEDGMARVTWQSSLDTSAVWGKLHTDGSSNDPNFVAPGAIPWLLLDKAGARRGPTGGDLLTNTTFIQRLNTQGGLAPDTGCSTAANVGAIALRPYSADYFFYKKSEE